MHYNCGAGSLGSKCSIRSIPDTMYRVTFWTTLEFPLIAGLGSVWFREKSWTSVLQSVT
jgi:hypothetical protein